MALSTSTGTAQIRAVPLRLVIPPLVAQKGVSGSGGAPVDTASYWVLEEDGTSKWELEEGGSYWITEESS